MTGFILAFNKVIQIHIQGVRTVRTSMTYPIRFWALVLSGLLLYQFSSEASADRCKFEKDIDLTLDLSTSDILAITASGGDFRVLKEGSGGIRSRDIMGEIEIPRSG